jgi:hypothetical protein
MRALGLAATFAAAFAVLGLLVGYGIYGKSGNEYIDPARFFESGQSGVSGLLRRVSDKVDRIEEKREHILTIAAIGGVAGLLLGGLVGRGRSSKRQRARR